MDKSDVKSALWNLDTADVDALVTQIQAGKSIGDLISGAYQLPTIPEVPATPDAQDIVDALLALGLVTQAEA